MPALEDRGGDALELAHHFLRLQREALGRSQLRLAASAIAAIRGHAWPGNVRELESRVRRGALLAEGDTVAAHDLGLGEAQAAASLAAAEPAIAPLAIARDMYLKRYVTEVVERVGGNRTEAAKALGVTARTVFKYLEEI